MDFSQVKAITIPEGNVNRILSGTTVLWKKIGGLPSEYQQVEYIANSGTQYIKTGKAYLANDRIEIDFTCPNDGYVFGVYVNDNTKTILDMFYHKIRFDMDAVGDTLAMGTRCYVVKDGGTWTYNGATYAGSNAGALDYPIVIFGRNYKNIVNQPAYAMQIYSYKHIRDGACILNLVPCYRKSDNEAGMYDTVTGTFYTNVGTGVFTLGPDV